MTEKGALAECKRGVKHILQKHVEWVADGNRLGLNPSGRETIQGNRQHSINLFYLTALEALLEKRKEIISGKIRFGLKNINGCPCQFQESQNCTVIRRQPLKTLLLCHTMST